jgi:hypothetical protein
VTIGAATGGDGGGGAGGEAAGGAGGEAKAGERGVDPPFRIFGIPSNGMNGLSAAARMNEPPACDVDDDVLGSAVSATPGFVGLSASASPSPLVEVLPAPEASGPTAVVGAPPPVAEPAVTAEEWRCELP